MQDTRLISNSKSHRSDFIRGCVENNSLSGEEHCREKDYEETLNLRERLHMVLLLTGLEPSMELECRSVAREKLVRTGIRTSHDQRKNALQKLSETTWLKACAWVNRLQCYLQINFSI